MEKIFNIHSIGTVHACKGEFSIHINKSYLPALTNIDGFNILQVIWWGNKNDNLENRQILTVEKPYKYSPEKLGIFATRSDYRPNPILITNVFVINIDHEKGIIYTPYIDADDGTPVIDIKPYHKLERVESCQVPEWCSHWPNSYEEAGNFNWVDEFNF